MPLITQTIKSLKGGMSQQPDNLRFADQCELQVNAFPSEVQGLQKRPPSKLKKRLRGPYVARPLVHLINRDATERYYVMFSSDGGIEVYDLFTGDQRTVNSPGGRGYVTTADPRRDLRCVTVADYTFITNRTVKVSEAPSVSHPGYAENGQFLLSIKSGQYGKTYTVNVNGLAVSHTTPDGTDASHSPQIDTQFIAQKVMDALVAGFPTWTFTIGPAWVKGVPPAGTTVDSLKTADGFNNLAMTGVVFDAQRFNMLPAQAPEGYIVRVSGDPGSGSDDYYVVYDSTGLVWKETVRPGLKVAPLASSMPHVLIREADGTFTFREQTWEPRAAGDEDSNPMPSFMDLGVSDIFFYRNRLGMLAGENVILSRSGEFFAFFPKSVVASADTDPLDVAVSHSRVSNLNHAVPFSEELLLWSDQAQFVLRSDGVLSPRTVRADQSTEFENEVVARPVPAGRSVYFATARATYSSIMRYYNVAEVQALKNAEDMSGHVPYLIENGIFYLGASTSENVVTVLTEGNERRIYLYKYLYLEEQLVQQAWGYWEFQEGDRVLACEFIGSTMHLLRDNANGLYLETIELTQNTKDYPGERYRVYADMKAMASGAALRYDLPSDSTYVLLESIYGPITGFKPEAFFWAVRDDGRTYRITPEEIGGEWVLDLGKGNLTTRTFTVGIGYGVTYVFSKLLIKVTDQSGTRTEDVGRLQTKRAWVNHDRSGPFVVHVGDYKATMSGKFLGNYILGEESWATGQFQFPVMQNAVDTNVKITSDSPTPLALTGAGWTGVYWRRARAI